MMPQLRITHDKISVFDAEETLIKYIVENIKETPLEYMGDDEFEGNFDFEVETSDEALIFNVKGRLYMTCEITPEARQQPSEAGEKSYSLYGFQISANYNGDDVDITYNGKIDSLIKFVTHIERIIEN